MNRRQKIIVSITGIFLVLLILVGLTYGYFLTRIQGNSNSKSISATTANLSLEYQDGNGSIINKDGITPGMEVGSKTFSVYNSGDGEVEYAVILDNVKITDKTGETETKLISNDFVYTLTCSDNCNGQEEETILPLIDNGLLVTNKIASTTTQSYTIKVKYKDTGKDQSADMGKKVEARINIEDVKKINPYNNDKQTLAYNIINNALTTKNGTEFKVTPETEPLKEISATYRYAKEVEEATNSTSISASNYYQSMYWTYGTGYTVDEETGKFTLTGVNTCRYNDGTCHQTLIGKYLAADGPYYNSNSSNTPVSTTNLTNIYKVIEAPAGSSGYIDIKANRISAIPISFERELSTAGDDYGTSYYYRGNVEDNYVNFASMCWRIVRIQGDGSIKLVLAAEKECKSGNLTTSSGFATNGAKEEVGTVIKPHYGYKMMGDDTYVNDYVNSAASPGSGAKKKLDEWLETKIGASDPNYAKLKEENWCIGDLKNAYDYGSYGSNPSGQIVGNVNDLINKITSFYYTAGNRFNYLKTPKIKCETTGTEGEIDKDRVGMLTMDEVAFAGADNNYTSNSNYYLNKNATTNYWWTITPSNFGYDDPAFVYVGAFFVGVAGDITYNSVRTDCGLRPAVTLNPGIAISGGDGTLEKPYVIAD